MRWRPPKLNIAFLFGEFLELDDLPTVSTLPPTDEGDVCLIHGSFFKMHLMCCTPVERLANLNRKNKVPGIRDYLLAQRIKIC